MNKIPVIEFKSSIPSENEIEFQFKKLFMKEFGCTEDEYNDMLIKCENPYDFMVAFIHLMKSFESANGMEIERAKYLLFPLVDTVNRAYGSCIIPDVSLGATGFKNETYQDYREEVEEHKRLMAKRFNWNLWDIKNVYAKVFHKAITETNGKVGKGTLVQALNDLKEAKVIYDYNVTDIIFSRDKNGNKIYNPHKSQVNSYFRPGYRVRGKLGPEYKKKVLF